jgi:hypothetical protein
MKVRKSPSIGNARNISLKIEHISNEAKDRRFTLSNYRTREKFTVDVAIQRTNSCSQTGPLKQKHQASQGNSRA